jgi:hypothetical protein
VVAHPVLENNNFSANSPAVAAGEPRGAERQR